MVRDAKRILEEQVRAGHCHGYALGVARGEGPVKVVTGGSLGGPGTLPVSPQTRFDLDCLTEVLCAAPLCLLAVEMGLLTLSDPVSHYLDLPGDKKDMTLWHLLTHTGGLQPSFLLEPEAVAPEGAVRAIFARPLGAEAGKRVKHSGAGYIALGRVLEMAFGLPLDKAAKKYLYDPLAMKRTGFLPTGGDIAHSGADTVTGQARIGEPYDENARFLHGVCATAGLFADAGDVARFGQMLLSGGRLGGKRVLSQGSVALAIREHTQGMKEAYGLGFLVSGRENSFFGDLWPKGGFGQTGYTGASLAVEPVSGLSVALLMNWTHPAKENPALHRVRRLVHNCVYAQGDAREDGL